MKLRVLAFALAILAFFIFVGSPFQQAAKAVAIVDDALIAIIIAALAAWGITFTYTGGYYTLYDWIAQTVYDSGVSFAGLNVGVNSTSNLLLNNRFVLSLQTFAAYLISRYGLNSNDSVNVVSPTVNVYDELSGRYYVPAVYVNESTFVEGTMLWNFDGGSPIGYEQNQYFRFNGTYYKFRMYMLTATVAMLYVSTSEDGENWSSEQFVFSDGQVSYNPWRYEFYTYYENGEVWLLMRTRTRDNATEEAYLSKAYQLQYVSVGNTIDLDTDFINVPSDSEIGDKGGKLTLPIPWGLTYGEAIDSIPDLTDNDELEGNTTLTLDDQEVIESEINQEATNAQNVSSRPGDYQVMGLSSVFPFCIPFDLYNFVSCLAADPVAPSFTWRFYVPGICDESIEIDLAEFNAAAQILRTMELLLFCVGLAFVTRKIIRG